ncbi:MAG TPA: hypothetical protein VI564_04275 [Candidatus Nanoarchaeia archaeon]|nr:hypothetical protein [Candidatus Nanoarchaeia archaeon]
MPSGKPIIIEEEGYIEYNSKEPGNIKITIAPGLFDKFHFEVTISEDELKKLMKYLGDHGRLK